MCARQCGSGAARPWAWHRAGNMGAHGRPQAPEPGEGNTSSSIFSPRNIIKLGCKWRSKACTVSGVARSHPPTGIIGSPSGPAHVQNKVVCFVLLASYSWLDGAWLIYEAAYDIGSGTNLATS